jgi:hypothetical protein
MRNEYLDSAVATLRDAGIHGFIIVPGGKHPQIRWECRGRPRFYVLSGTPSDRNAHHAADGLLQPLPDAPKPPPKAPSLQERVLRLERQVEELADALRQKVVT